MKSGFVETKSFNCRTKTLLNKRISFNPRKNHANNGIIYCLLSVKCIILHIEVYKKLIPI